MSKTEAKVDFILEMIENIQKIIKRHKGIIKALDDYEGKMAIMMGLLQIGESLNKIDKKYLEKYDLIDDTKGAYNVRNFIAHDYEGVNMVVVEDIVRLYLPKLEDKIVKMNMELNSDTN